MDPAPEISPQPIRAALVLDDVYFHRFRAVLRHLCVGLIDLISGVRLVTAAPEVESLNLGPVHTVLHGPMRWPLKHHRLHALVEALKEPAPTVVHALAASGYETAERIAEHFNIDIVYQVAGIDDIDSLGHARWTTPSHVVCASEPLCELLLSRHPARADDVSVIRPGVSCAKEATCFRDESKDPTILSTADLTPDGGVHTLLQAVSRLRDRCDRFLVFLVGSGPEEHRLRHLARSLGLSDIVVFAQPEGDMHHAMVGADIFVQPIVETSISARSLQALGQGMAVVTVAGGVQDAYVPDETALVAPAATASELAATIERLLKDRHLARRLATNAIDYMRTHHTMSAMAEATDAVYRRLALRRATFKMPR